MIDKLLQNELAVEALITSLTEAEASTVVDRLKSEADQHWYIDANRSLTLAELIIQIGRVRKNDWQIALGLMARGDALKFIGHAEEAWQAFEEAGRLFQAIGDEVGWARTRIGRLVICVELNHAAEALADAETARAIFTRNNEYDRLIGINCNAAIVHMFLDEYDKALSCYQSALTTAESLGDQGNRHVGIIHLDIGYVFTHLSDFRQALHHYRNARRIFGIRKEQRGIAMAERNIADIMIAEGQYQTALQHFYKARNLYLKDNLSLEVTNVNHAIVRSYLLLHRYQEARQLAQTVIQEYQTVGASYQEGLTRLYQATAETALGRAEEAYHTLISAEVLFREIGAVELIQHVHQARNALRPRAALDFSRNNKEILEPLLGIQKQTTATQMYERVHVFTDTEQAQKIATYVHMYGQFYGDVASRSSSEPDYTMMTGMSSPSAPSEQRMHLTALARALLEDDDRAFLNTTYTIQAGIAQILVECVESVMPLPTNRPDALISLDILCHTSDHLTLLSDWQATLYYQANQHYAQFVEFCFHAHEPGQATVTIDFYHQRRWLRTMTFVFDVVASAPSPTAQ